MDPRYVNPEIAKEFSKERKVERWLDTELAKIRAEANLLRIPESIFAQIDGTLRSVEIDIDLWLEIEGKVKHDLAAFVKERSGRLLVQLQPYFHAGLTSYDTEEPAFASMLKASISVFKGYLKPLVETIKDMAIRYRYTVMNGRTHGQEAKLQSFGKRCLTWLVQLGVGMDLLEKAEENLKFSKLSGALGNYGGVDPDVEKETLDILGFQPFYGATQIMPRELYLLPAMAICQITLTIQKIALDIRLGARSGRPIYQEPFGTGQMGSSVMPHKKNTVLCEKLEGMGRLAKGYLMTILDNIITWEERSIEQSSVERVAWPDLFHVGVHAARTITTVLRGLKVYPDNMLAEINSSCGCYAADEAKEFLRHEGASHGLSVEDVYGLIQLAAFNALAPDEVARTLRQNPVTSFAEAEKAFEQFSHPKTRIPISIRVIIADSMLVTSDELEATAETVVRWNQVLREIFKDPKNLEEWHRIFTPSHLLRNEKTLYKEILGC
jgi:adenylosuccinate lyase